MSLVKSSLGFAPFSAGRREPPRSATARRPAGVPGGRPRSAPERAAATGALGRRAGRGAGGLPGLRSRRVTAGPRGVRSGTPTPRAPWKRGPADLSADAPRWHQSGPAGGDSERLPGNPGKETPPTPRTRAGVTLRAGPTRGPRRARAGTQLGRGSPDPGGGARTGRRRKRAAVPWPGVRVSSPSVGGGELHVCAHT